MYKFRDTTKQEHYRNLPFIPTSAMNYDERCILSALNHKKCKWEE